MTQGKGKLGKNFEKDFQDSCKKTNFFFLRLVDSAKWTQGQGTSFTPSNIADSVFFTSPLFWILELKSTEQAGISFFPFSYVNGELFSAPYQRPNKETKTAKMIKPSQVEDLMKISASHREHGVMCGFIFNFRARELKTKSTPNRVFFVHIDDFLEFAKLGTSSIGIEACEQIGIEIIGEIKKVHYKYDINKFINDATKHYIFKNYITKEFLETIKTRIEKLLTFIEKRD